MIVGLRGRLSCQSQQQLFGGPWLKLSSQSETVTATHSINNLMLAVNQQLEELKVFVLKTINCP